MSNHLFRILALILACSNPITNYYSEPVLFEITDNEIHGIEIKVRKGSTISGQVVIEGAIEPAVLAKIPDLIVEIHGSRDRVDQLTSSYNYNNKVNPDCSFQFHALPPGMARIGLITSAELHGLNLIRIERNGLAQSGNGIEIGAGEDISNLRLIVSNGTLTLRGGQPFLSTHDISPLPLCAASACSAPLRCVVVLQDAVSTRKMLLAP